MKNIKEVALDISKAFDKVWHEGLIVKLKSCGIGSLLGLLKSYRIAPQQRIVLKRQTSS